MPPILLASSSVYRAQLLNKLGLAFTQASPDIDERAATNEAPDELAKRLSMQKAEALIKHYPNRIIIASDQVAATHNKSFLGKPHNRNNAIAQLSKASGNIVDFYTGLAVHYSHATGNFQMQLAVERCRVHFRQLSLSQIENYVDAEQPFDCAGSFKAEGLGISLFTKIEVEDPNTLVGLPLIRLVEFLNNLGVDVLNQKTNTKP
jgi:MAF protein